MGAAEWDETQTVGEYLVLDDRGVLVDEDIFDGESGNLSEKNSSEGVCDCSVYAGEREGSIVRGMGVEFDVEVLRLKLV